MQELAEGRAGWALPWPCAHEFLAVVTHPKIYAPPSTTAQALDQIEAWLATPTVVLLAEGEAHWPTLRRTLTNSRLRGQLVHDARVAALCQQHGVRELWTADRDFSRVPELHTKNPLVG